MTTDAAVLDGLVDAVAPPDEYDLPASFPFPEPTVAPSPSQMCACGQPGTGWAWSADRREWVAVCGRHQQVREPWQITDDRMASWAFRRQAAAQARIDHIDDLYADEIARLTAWRDAATATDRAKVAFMEAHLAGYLRRLRHDDPDRHSVRTPGGTVTHSRSQALLVDDETAVIVWAREHGYADKMVKESVSVSGVKSELAKDDKGVLVAVNVHGEPIPGIRIDPRDNFTVKPAPLPKP